ncbi:hypothetical protein UCRPC4_g05740 [Phaeomoniella chlamydospora]|uniref:Uncharacterized protein n=1 Tax=Phaeomoniella chlamydospora TaxID=158046 RepID=A0A0G2GJA2_PHACM|nr:hypothetical protein UCRPC4_g05740 [Phaeomoniella chlamydospora]
MGLITKAVGGVIGLTSETIAYRKERRQGQQQSQQAVEPEIGQSSTSRGGSSLAPPEYEHPDEKKSYNYRKSPSDLESDSDSEPDDIDNDSDEWAYDNAAAELEKNGIVPPSYEESQAEEQQQPMTSVDDAVDSFRLKYRAAFQVHRNEEVPLPCPVILPQRRPKDKKRGFASPVFDVFNVAAMIAGSVPSPIAMGVSIGVQIIANTGKEVQTRYRTNTYLNKINETLFMPHGLYCLVMTYKPSSASEAIVPIDITSTITKALTTPDSKFKSALHNIRASSGITTGDLALPESAPLTYPALDTAALASSTLSLSETQTLPPQTQSKLKTSQKFLADYLDRRSQATFAASNPSSRLAHAPAKNFSSRYADPTHPVYNGGLINFLSGGALATSRDRISRFAERDERKFQRKMRKEDRRAQRRGYTLNAHQREDIADAVRQSIEERRRNRSAGAGAGTRGKKGLVKRVMGKDVLYLMICNLPTEKEMDIAREQIQRLKRLKGRGEMTRATGRALLSGRVGSGD